MPRRAKRNQLVDSMLSSLEEMGHFPTEEDRRLAIEEHVRSASRGWGLWIGVACLTGAAVGAHFVLKFLLPTLLPAGTPRIAASLIHLGGVVAVYVVVLRALHRWGAAPEMRRRLLRAGVPVCLKCGYVLRGLTPDTPRCPECGRSIGRMARTLLRFPEQPPSP